MIHLYNIYIFIRMRCKNKKKGKGREERKNRGDMGRLYMELRNAGEKQGITKQKLRERVKRKIGKKIGERVKL